MIIYTPKKALLFRLKDPAKVTTVIPTAKTFLLKGKELTAVPHKPEETRVLRNLGYDVPSPMNYYYPYEGKFKPFDAQKQTAEFASMNPRCFILNSMGLGKTITSLWATDYLRSCGLVKRTLIVCPISVMERTWADEIFRSFPGASFQVLYGTRERRLRLLAEEADYYIINTDGVKIIEEALADRPDINHVIIDEVALFRNSGAARWKSMNTVCNKQAEGKRRVWGLTGSPIPNSPEDAFGQVKLVNPASPDCPKYFARWRAEVMVQISQFKWKPKPNAAALVHKIMQPAIRFSLDDVVDLPPQVYQLRKITLTKEQEKAYKSMKERLVAELKEGSVLAVNEAVKCSKLMQIVCGVAYGDGGQCLPLNCAARLEATDEIVNESEGKVIIFVPFSGALEQLRDYLVDKGHTVAVVDGATAKADRDEIFHSFQTTDSPRVIIANPATMSHGLTLTAATTIVWFGPVYSNEVYQQACARVRRPGQKRTTVIVHLVSTPLEERIYDRLAGKQEIQGSLLDLVKDSD